jgi:hypothetical protein
MDRFLWIDAICINQLDQQEKEHQIQVMVKNYGLAMRVVVWLGPAADNSDLALDALRHAANERLKSVSDMTEFELAVIQLIHRHWFRRVWGSL